MLVTSDRQALDAARLRDDRVRLDDPTNYDLTAAMRRDRISSIYIVLGFVSAECPMSVRALSIVVLKRCTVTMITIMLLL